MASQDLELLIKARDETAKAMAQARGRMDKLADRARTARGPLLAVTGAITGIGFVGVKMAADFETAFAEVKTLLPDLDQGGMKQLRQGILDFSKEMGIATSDAVPALYQAISAGVPPSNVLEFMRTSAKASIGGVTDLQTAVDGITSVVNSYGEGVIDAQKAADLMFTGVKLGKTDFEQMSRSLFNVVPTAASLGVGFEEITAALATMTAQGVPTAQATTSLRQAFVEASDTGSKMDQAIKGIAGGSFADLIAQGGSATGIFETLRQAMPEQAFRDMFSSVEAANAVLQLTGPNAAAVKDALSEMDASAGSVDTAFGVMSDTASFKFKEAMAGLRVELIALGDVLMPIVGGMVKVVGGLIQRFSALPAPVKGAVIVIGGMVGVVAALGLILPPLITGIGLLKGAFFAVKGALIAARLASIAFMTTPLGLAILGIVAAVTAGILIWKNWDRILAFIKKQWKTVSEVISEVFRSKWAWLLPGGVLIKAILAIKDNWDAIWDGISSGFGAIMDGVTAVAKGGINAIIGFFNTMIRAWNALDFKVPEFKVGPIKFGGFAVGLPDIPTIPHLAEGIRSFQGGLAFVGERGPELVTLPRGSAVTPNAQLASMRAVTIVNNFYGTVIGPRDVEELIVTTVRDHTGRGGFVQ